MTRMKVGGSPYHQGQIAQGQADPPQMSRNTMGTQHETPQQVKAFEI